MDSNSGTSPPHPIGIKASSSQFPSSGTRKRSRGSSEDIEGATAATAVTTDAKEEKRLKARERQRRKRERDRSGRDRSGGSSMVTLSTSAVPVGVGVAGVFPPPPNEEAPQQMMNMYGHHPPDGLPNSNNSTGAGDPNSSPSATSTQNGHTRGGGRVPSDTSNLTPEEIAKKDRIRIAARERQRKHRAAVKAKRMAEMGLTIVTPTGVEQPAMHFVMNEHGQYDPVLDDPSQHPHQHPHHPHPHPHAHPHPHPPLQVLQEPPFPVPQSHMTLGQTFAQTLLLSISCTPMLKQHLLRTLHMSEEELNSLEPMIATAWDHWDHDRALHYAAAANASVSGPADHNAPSTSYIPPHPPPPNTTTGPNTNPNQPPNPHNMYPTDFRERFTRPLVAPFPSNAPILRPMHHPHPHGQPQPPNGSASATNGTFGGDQRDEEGDSDRDGGDEHAGSPPPMPAATTTDSIDPNLESEGTSHVRTAEPGKNPSAQSEILTTDRKSEN